MEKSVINIASPLGVQSAYVCLETINHIEIDIKLLLLEVVKEFFLEYVQMFEKIRSHIYIIRPSMISLYIRYHNAKPL